jgi:hypothetical protein
MLGSILVTTIAASIVTLYFALSPKQQEQLQGEFESFPSLPQSSLLYEYTFTHSSATGECGSTTTERWYGLETDDYIPDWYNNQLSGNGWQRHNRAWLKDTRQGVFTLNIEVYSDTMSIDPFRVYYTIPNDVVVQAHNYPVVCVFSLRLMYHSARARCLEQ